MNFLRLLHWLAPECEHDRDQKAAFCFLHDYMYNFHHVERVCCGMSFTFQVSTNNTTSSMSNLSSNFLLSFLPPATNHTCAHEYHRDWWPYKRHPPPS
jgi:hypothetical protein